MSTAGRPGFLRAPFSARTWGETTHLVLNLVIGIAGFVWVVTLTSLGIGLIPLFLVGLPLLAATLFSCRGLGAVERARARGLLREYVQAPQPMTVRGPGAWGWMKSALSDGTSWRAWLYLLLMLPWGVFTFSVTVSLWAVALGCLTYPATQPLYRLAHQPGVLLYGNGPKGPGHSTYLAGPWWVAATVAVGVVFLFVTPWVVRGLAWVDRSMVRGLLGTAFLSEQVRDLTESRGAAVDTAAADLRRIERDLHDGAQARLVSLAMDLGMAKERMKDDDAGDPRTREMVSAAHDEVKLALQELRDLARGIHPAVLTDRGLDAALSAVAARSPVPVDVRVDMPRRPSMAVESAAYFSATELLTNVAKHAQARSAVLEVTERGDRLTVQVRDDGRGGAHIGKGTGLAGLAERVRGLGGTLEITSPDEGGTVATVTLPF